MHSSLRWRRPIIAFLAAASLGFCSAYGEITLSVLSYNIHRDIGASDSNISSQASLAKVVNYLNPDVWTINELGGNNVSYSSVNARDYLTTFINTNLTIFGANPQLNVDYYIYLDTYNDGFETNAIVSRYPFLSTQSFTDAGGGYSHLRGLALVVVDVPGTSNDVGVFTTHLKALGTTADAARRQAEADVDRVNISNWITAHPAFGTIVTGDWNESEDAADGTNWTGHSIGDTIQLQNGTSEPYHPISTVLSAGLKDPVPVSIAGDNDTIDSTGPTARFDYLTYAGSSLSYRGGQVFDTGQYTTAQLNTLKTVSGIAFAKGTSSDASDHLPVFATFAIVPEPTTAALLGAGILWLGVGWGRRRYRSSPAMQTYLRTR